MPMPMDIDHGELHPEVAAPQPEPPVQGGDTTVAVDKDSAGESSWPTHRLTGNLNLEAIAASSSSRNCCTIG
eukprot:6172388-Amphidinium_carterae.1